MMYGFKKIKAFLEAHGEFGRQRIGVSDNILSAIAAVPICIMPLLMDIQ